MVTTNLALPSFPPQPSPFPADDFSFVAAAARSYRERFPSGVDLAELPVSDLQEICRVARTLKLLGDHN